MLKTNSLEYFKRKFPQDTESARLLSLYCKRINFNPSIEKIEKDHLEKLFKVIMSDYLEYRIDSDQLSNLFGKISFLIQDDRPLAHTEMGYNLIDFAELEIVLRTNPGAAESTLTKMLRLYESLKNPV